MTKSRHSSCDRHTNVRRWQKLRALPMDVFANRSVPKAEGSSPSMACSSRPAWAFPFAVLRAPLSRPTCAAGLATSRDRVC